VIPNQGALKRCQGCRQMFDLLLFRVLPLRSYKVSFFCQVRVPPNFLLVPKGAVNQKRLKNTALSSYEGGKTKCFLIFFSILNFDFKVYEHKKSSLESTLRIKKLKRHLLSCQFTLWFKASFAISTTGD